jgi:hypothetical protein
VSNIAFYLTLPAWIVMVDQLLPIGKCVACKRRPSARELSAPIRKPIRNQRLREKDVISCSSAIKCVEVFVRLPLTVSSMCIG